MSTGYSLASQKSHLGSCEVQVIIVYVRHSHSGKLFLTKTALKTNAKEAIASA